MRRWDLVGRQQIEFRNDLPPPEATGDNVLVKVKACTICGRSDLVYYHYLHLRDHCESGCFGHEIAGVVEAIGSRVTRVQPGQRVFLRTPLTTGYADYALAREIAVGHLPPQIPFEQGAILQLLPLCVYATRGVQLGDRVLIVGQGPVGLMALQTARLRGAAFIATTDLDLWRRQRSMALGADQSIPAELSGNLADLGPFDVAIEAVGTPATARFCVDSVRQNGTVVFLGTHHVDTKVTFDLVQWEKKGLRVQMAAEPTDAARVATLETAQSLIDNQRIQLEPLLTETIPLPELPAAIERLSRSPLLYAAGEPCPYEVPPERTLKLAICP